METLVKRIVALFALIFPLMAYDAAASDNAVGSNKLAYLIPNLFGNSGIVLPNVAHTAHFTSALQSNFGPFTTSLVSQLTSLPIPSPASGFIFSFDKSLGVYSQSTQSFGPIYAERAETLGKNKFFVGFSYQNFSFDKLDGIDLKRVPSVFQHQPTGQPNYVQDVITTMNSFDVKFGQRAAFFTYGLTDRLDVSVALPFNSATIEAVSDAKIQRIGTSAEPDVHYFDTPFGDRTQKTFARSGSAQGLGDVVVRVKGTAAQFKNGGLALGVDARMPTGDAYDFLGSGAYGVRPFMALSWRRGNLSPHLNLAYQWNGKSILAGDLISGVTGDLPDQVQYVAGIDYGITKKFTLALDYLGQRQLNAKRVTRTTFRAANNAIFPQIAISDASFQQSSLATGFKVNPVASLLVSFNLLFALDNNGLRDLITPLIGLSYTF